MVYSGRNSAWKQEIDQERQGDTFLLYVNYFRKNLQEVQIFYDKFETKERPNRFFEIIFWMGNLAIKEILEDKKRVINFSPVLREQIGHHIYGEKWAKRIKDVIYQKNLLHREIHIISANMHSVMNSLYIKLALPQEFEKNPGMGMFELLSKEENDHLQKAVEEIGSKERPGVC